MKKLFLFLLFVSFVVRGLSQGLVINEVLVNASGGSGLGNGCDGGCEPNNAEWIELYNKNCTPLDISCYILVTTKFAVIFPAGTILPPYSYYVLGSTNFGTTVIDMQWNNPNINDFGPINVGNIGNNDDFLLLFDNNQIVIDGIKFGAPSFSAVPTTFSNVASCGTLTIPTITNSVFSASGLLSGAGSDGETWARNVDGGCTWVTRAGSAISKRASNGSSPHVNFIASDTTICPNNCINFQDLSTGAGSTYNWAFNAATTTSSTIQNPLNICYANAGQYEVTLTVTNNNCNYSCTKVNYIDVANSFTATATAAGATTFCTGDFVILNANTDPTFAYQWILNGANISGATNASFSAIVSGNYAVLISDGNCVDTSNVITVTVSNNLAANINMAPSVTICNGDSVILIATPSAAFSYQWFNGAAAIASATNANFTANVTGNYSVLVTDANGCTGDDTTAVTINTIVAPTVISDVASLSLCGVSSINLSVPNTFTTYQWLNTSNAAIAGQTSNLLNVTVAGSYSLIVTDVNSCTDTTTVTTITNGLNTTLTLAISGPLTFCQGSSVTLDAGSFAGSNYQWFNNATAVAGATAQTLLVTSAGNYTAQVIDAGGCSVTSGDTAVVILPNPNVTINASSSLSFCQGNNVTLSPTTGGTSYQWLNNNIAIAGQTNITYTSTFAGNFSLVLTNANGCSDTSNVLTTIITIPFTDSIASSTNSFIFCPGTSITLTAFPQGLSYQWTINNIPSPNNTGTLVANSAGNYSVVITDANGCTNSKNITVSTYQAPFPFVLPASNVSICSGAGVLINTTPFVSYQWFLNANPIPGATSQFTTAAVAGAYNVTVTDVNGCQATSPSKSIIAVSSPTPDIVSSSPEVCEDEIRTIFVDSNYVSYLWSTGQTAQSIDVSQPGVYSVIVKDVNNCTANTNATLSFKPKPLLSLPATIELQCGTPDTIRALTNGSIVWTPKYGIGNANSATTALTAKVETYYRATATLDGCKTLDSVLVTIGKCDSVYIPSAFTPNADTYNDVFKITGKSIKFLKFEIFNRWGESVFYTADPNIGWDGTYKFKDCPTGIYNWQIEAFDYFDRKVLIREPRGVVTLIR